MSVLFLAPADFSARYGSLAPPIDRYEQLDLDGQLDRLIHESP